MREASLPYKKQLFVCCHEKTDGTGCRSKGGEELRNRLKERLNKHPELVAKMRVNKCGCMNFCNDGISVQIQPTDKLLLNVTLEDEDKLWEVFLGEEELRP